MKSQVYNQAKYYEIAFDFVDVKSQTKLFEKFIKKYSSVNVESVLDLACGNALQLREMAKRGYKSIGIDSSQQMLDYLEKESKRDSLEIKTIKSDINTFKLKQKVDFAYIMMGSILYAMKDNETFITHLDCVANSLKSGSLYLIENLPIDWANKAFLKPQKWTMKKEDIKVKVTYQLSPKNLLKQIVTQKLKMEVNDNGIKMEFVDNDIIKIIFPEELKLLIEKNKKFEFLGFFERYNTKQLNDISNDNFVILRKK
jgi:ubiquinone/menaquinone biosynthesis C-methylase UbiE